MSRFHYLHTYTDRDFREIELETWGDCLAQLLDNAGWCYSDVPDPVSRPADSHEHEEMIREWYAEQDGSDEAEREALSAIETEHAIDALKEGSDE